MKNPWLDLRNESPFVLDCDREKIHLFNQSVKARHKLRVDIIPEPYLGHPTAPILLLNLNPGYSPKDKWIHAEKSFAAASMASLAIQKQAYPFYLLNPAFSKSPGHQWWTRRLQSLIAEYGVDLVAKKVCCVELFPDHSISFNKRCLGVPSQAYGSHIVRSAIERGALIVQMRSRALWEAAVPELGGYTKRIFLKNVQSPYISRGNCEHYDELCAVLSR